MFSDFQRFYHRRINHQHLLSAILVVLWAGVLPWLCWGGWSVPGHPHLSPHFVFAAPPLQAATYHSHTHQPFDDHPTDDVAGVARPDSLLLALLAALIISSRIVIGPRLHRFVRHLAPLMARPIVRTVPTPPPRWMAATA